MKRGSRAPVRILSVALGLAVGVVLAEVATRMLSLAPSPETAYRGFAADPYLPFKPQPSTRLTGRMEEFAYDYRHNSFGFRDVEHSLEKEKGTFRILGLGDSFTYGAGVAFAETYLHRLEVMLNGRGATHPRVEVIKAGIPRYFPEAERILFEKYGVQFRPDLILIGLLPNDVIDTYLGLDAVSVSSSGYLMSREARELGSVGMQVYRHSDLGRLLLKRYVDWRIARHFQGRFDEVFQDHGIHEKDWQTIEREYDRMAAIAASIGARMLVLYIPQKGPWTVKSRYPAVRVGAWAAKRRVDFVDLLPALERNSTGELLYYEKDGHTTAAGHRVIAQDLYRYLTDRNLVP